MEHHYQIISFYDMSKFTEDGVIQLISSALFWRRLIPVEMISGGIAQNVLPLEAKLSMWCSPIFMCTPHIVLMHINHEAFKMVQSHFWKYLNQFLVIEQFVSFVSLIFSMIADSYVGRTDIMKASMFFTVVPLVLLAVAGGAGKDTISELDRTTLSNNGIGCMTIFFLLIPIERAYTSEFINPDSPLLRKYYFFIFYLNYAWQGVFGIMLNVPNLFPHLGIQEEVKLTVHSFQIILWISMLGCYCLLLFLKREESAATQFGLGPRVVLCIYTEIWGVLVTILQGIRDRDYDLDRSFKKAETFFKPEVIKMARSLLRLFVIHFCLLFFHGLETMLRTIWYHQDTVMARSDIFAAFPLDVIFLVLLSILYPITEYFILPLMKKWTRVEPSELQFVGAAYVLLSLAYVATMLIEVLIGQSTDDMPSSEKVVIRAFNGLDYPVGWAVMSGLTLLGFLHIPAMKSRLFMNNAKGEYVNIFNNSYFNKSTIFALKMGEMKHILLREDGIKSMELLDQIIQTYPKPNVPDSHVFVINAFSSSDAKYQQGLQLNVTGTDQVVMDGLVENVTHILIAKGEYNITVTDGKKKLVKSLFLQNYCAHSVLLYDTISRELGADISEIRKGLTKSRLFGLIQVLLTVLAISLGKVSIYMYTYKHAAMSLLSTSFALHRCAIATSIVSFNSLLKKYSYSLTTVLSIGFLIFFFLLIFLYATVRNDFSSIDVDENESEFSGRPLQNLGDEDDPTR